MSLQYERRHHPLLPRRKFLRRVAAHGGIGLAAIGVSLVIGVIGYHNLARLTWVDAFLNAAMIMGGMGPVDALPTTAAKLFASFYALYSGCILLIAVGVFFAPVLHRILHGFHLPERNG
jgi:hypothetical protein